MHERDSGSQRGRRLTAERAGRAWLVARVARVAFPFVLAMVVIGCERPDPRLESLRQLEPAPPTEDRIRELEALVEEYGEIVAERIEAAFQQADALKLLAQEYMRQELYGPALDALEEAITIQPRNQVLHYLAGVAAGYLGDAQARSDRRRDFLARAERSYQIAIDIDPNYIDARYGLAVLYVFELGEPVQALPHLNRVLERNEEHVPSLFVLGRAHVELGNIDDAINAYERIIETAPDAESRRRAERNRQLLLGGGT